MDKDNSIQNLKRVLDHITDVIILCNKDFEIIDSNNAAQTIFSRGGSISGLKCHDLLHNKSEPCEDCPLDETVISGRLKHYNYFNDSIGEYIEERTHPIMQDDDTVDSFILLCRNVTEIREIEDQVAQAKKMAAIGQISSGVAHDFNNVITGILGRIRIMRKSFTNPVFEEQLELLEKAAKAGAETVRRMQEFTRAGKEKSFIDINLPELIREVVALTRPKWHDAAKKDGRLVKVNFDLEEDVYIQGNTSELHNALTNLIFNSVDAMPDGGFISFKCVREGNLVNVRMEDTGIGMTDEVCEKVFDPFFTTKGRAGNGLGMSEVYGVVKRHSGKIGVESEVGVGTTLSLSFPYHAPEVVFEEDVDLDVGSQRILIVDDEEFILESMLDLLEELGHTVSQFDNPLEALANFNVGNFDIVFTDLEMPGLNGQEFAEKIKEIEPELPIVLLSGWLIDLSEEKELARVIDFVISKPFTTGEIKAVIAKAKGLGKKWKMEKDMKIY